MPGENLVVEIPVGLLFAFGFSAWVHRGDPPRDDKAQGLPPGETS